jgi:hypothetical protein
VGVGDSRRRHAVMDSPVSGALAHGAEHINSMLPSQQQVQQRLAAEREQAQRERLAAESVERARLAAQRRAEEERLRRERDFERAFLASYTASEGCDNWRSDSRMVECANHKMRAKSAFRCRFFR